MDVPCAIIQLSQSRLSQLGGVPSSLEAERVDQDFNLEDYQIALLDVQIPANVGVWGTPATAADGVASSKSSSKNTANNDRTTDYTDLASSSLDLKTGPPKRSNFSSSKGTSNSDLAGSNSSLSPKVPQKTIKILPKSRLNRSLNGDYSLAAASDAIIRMYSSLYRHRPRRVVPVPAWGSFYPASSSSSSGSRVAINSSSSSGSSGSLPPVAVANFVDIRRNRSPLGFPLGAGAPRRQSVAGGSYSGGRMSPLVAGDLSRSASTQQPGGLTHLVSSSVAASLSTDGLVGISNGYAAGVMAQSNSPFYCIPVLANDNLEDESSKLKFYPLARVLSMCRNGSPLIDPESRHLLLRLEQWLGIRVKTQPGFHERFFLRPPSLSRLVACAHSPAHVDETNYCCRRKSQRSNRSKLVSLVRKVSSSSEASSTGQEPSELRVEDRRANNTLVAMMRLEKCDRFIINPLFNSTLPYKVSHGQAVVQYFAKNRPEPPPSRMSQSACPSDSSDCGSYMDEFPLHKYSYLGHSEAIQIFLMQGCDPDQLDRDAWAPIHYAAWYNQLAAVRALLNYGNCDVNVQNHNHSTPLHLAAYRGNHYVIELLLSHPGIHVEARDKAGKTALELCDKVPKTDWQACAKLLMAAQIDKLPKIQVDLMDGSNVMVPLLRQAETTTADLHALVCEELKLPEPCSRIFALWICSESLQIQLKAEQQPIRHINTWRQKLLTRLTDCQDPSHEEPRLVFRRDAKLSILVEKKTQLTDTTLDLLFHEARQNYERGLYPCADHDSVLLAATLLQIIHGNYDPKKTKHFLANEKSLAKLLPLHKVKQKGANWAQRILAEHKHVTAQGAKSLTGLQNQFLAFCWNLRVYGSAFFNGIVYMTKPIKGALHIHVGVNDFGLHLINSDTKKMFQSYPHEKLQWGFAGNDKPYIEVKASQNTQQHAFTLQTRQAPLINTLLSKLHHDGDSNQSSPALAR